MLDEKCPKCGNELVIKEGEYGKFIGCSNFPECHFSKSYNKENYVQLDEPFENHVGMWYEDLMWFDFH